MLELINEPASPSGDHKSQNKTPTRSAHPRGSSIRSQATVAPNGATSSSPPSSGPSPSRCHRRGGRRRRWPRRVALRPRLQLRRLAHRHRQLGHPPGHRRGDPSPTRPTGRPTLADPTAGPPTAASSSTSSWRRWGCRHRRRTSPARPRSTSCTAPTSRWAAPRRLSRRSCRAEGSHRSCRSPSPTRRAGSTAFCSFSTPQATGSARSWRAPSCTWERSDSTTTLSSPSSATAPSPWRRVWCRTSSGPSGRSSTTRSVLERGPWW